YPALAGGSRDRMALHRARQADAERFCRKLQRPTARRVSQRAPVCQSQRGSSDHRGMEDRLQHQSTAHEPQRAHTDRVRNPPQQGPNPERTLLINGGKLGIRSQYLKKHSEIRAILLEKPDRLYRNLKDWVTLDEFDVEIHLVKEGVVLSRQSRSSEKFMHGIKVLMAKNYIDNLSEEARKGMQEKAEQGLWPTIAPLGYKNQLGPEGKKIIDIDPVIGPVVTNLFN